MTTFYSCPPYLAPLLPASWRILALSWYQANPRHFLALLPESHGPAVAMPHSRCDQLWVRKDQKPLQGNLARREPFSGAEVREAQICITGYHLPADDLSPCLQHTYKQENLYLQNGVQLVIFHTYPKVPKQNTLKKKK